MHLKLQDGAIFIADAHENEKRRFFWDFLCELEKEHIKPSQLFLVGDMFDLFIGGANNTEAFALPYVKKLEKLANNFPIYYLEGNHDFNLKKYFKRVKVFNIDKQPLRIGGVDGDILLSHGDCYCGVGYKLYTSFIRYPFVVKILNYIDERLNGVIVKKILRDQFKKNLCRDIENFEEIISKKLASYPTENVSFVLEGHYHQNKKFSYKNFIYQNFSSFACDKSYFVVKCAQGMKITQTKLRNSHGDKL